MKKSIIITLVAMFFSMASFAQTNAAAQPEGREMPTVEQIAKRKAERLKQQLLLSQEQYDKVYQICLKQAENDVERMKQYKAEREKVSAEMKGILNETQYERYEKMQKAPHRRMRVGIHNGNMRGRGDMRRGNPKGELKPMPEIKYQARPMRGTVMEMHEEAYGDPKRNKNMYAEPKQEEKKQEKK